MFKPSFPIGNLTSLDHLIASTKLRAPNYDHKIGSQRRKELEKVQICYILDGSFSKEKNYLPTASYPYICPSSVNLHLLLIYQVFLQPISFMSWALTIATSQRPYSTILPLHSAYTSSLYSFAVYIYTQVIHCHLPQVLNRILHLGCFHY